MKHPRTMQEAFGPYTDNKLHDPMHYRPHNPFLHKNDLIVVCGSVVAIVALVVLMLAGWVV